MSNATDDILKPIEQIHRRGYTVSKVFRDWVRLMLYSLMRDDEKYLDVMDRYRNDGEPGEREADLFKEAFQILLAKMAADRQDDRNPREYLGDCYMTVAGKYSVQGMGQFFTPQPVCDMMAQMTIGDTSQEEPAVADPACGSGRLLHSAAKLLPITAHFTGVDLDSICAHMATLNLCFFNMNGVIVYGNALTMKYYRAWIIKRTPLGGTIRQMSKEELEDYYQARGEALKRAAEKKVESEPVSTNGSEVEESSTELEPQGQLALF